MSDDPRNDPTVLATCCLPLEEDHRLDVARFRATIRTLTAAGLRDLYIFGTAGEGHAVSDADFKYIAGVFVEEMTAVGGVPMIGVISTSLATVMERVEVAQHLGVTRVQFSLPNWGPAREVEVRAVFRELCDSFPNIQFLHYNLARSGRIVTPKEYAALADLHPNFVATKYGAGDPEMVSGLMRLSPRLTHYFTELGYFQGAALGRCGLLASISTLNGRRARDYFEAGQRGDWTELASMYRELAGVMIALRECVGTGLVDGAYDKTIAKIIDADFPLRLFPPQETAAEAAYLRLRQRLVDQFPLWLPSAAAPSHSAP